jgi:hypothetical protein
MIRRVVCLVFSALALFSLSRTAPSDARAVYFAGYFGFANPVSLPGAKLDVQVYTYSEKTFPIDA